MKVVRFCCVQINEFVKRARAAKVHAYITSHLKKEMPAMMGKSKTQKRLIDNLADEFVKVSFNPYTLNLLVRCSDSSKMSGMCRILKTRAFF